MQNPVLLPVKVVAIDLDGTLLDTAVDIGEAANRMLAELGRNRLAEATVASYIGNGVSRLVKRALTGEMAGEPDPAIFALALAAFNRHYAEVLCRTTRLYPGVLDGLHVLRVAAFPLVCITNKAAQFTHPLLMATGLAAYFDLVLSGDSLPRKKPDPLPLHHACRHFGVVPAEMLLIGDSLNDVQAARAAGCPVFCVPYGYNQGQQPVAQWDVDQVVPDLVVAARLIEASSSSAARSTA